MSHSAIRGAWLAAIAAACSAVAAHAATTVTVAPDTAPTPTRPVHMQTHAAHSHATVRDLPAPHLPHTLPRSHDEVKFNLPPTKKARTDLVGTSTGKRTAQRLTTATTMAATADCSDMNKLAGYSGSALANYIATLPDYECTYGLFSLSSAQAAVIYSPANVSAVVSRFAQEAGSYDATNMRLVNLALYLRAGYYLGADGGANISTSMTSPIRAAVKPLVQGWNLFKPNAAAHSTANEIMILITNMHDEAYYLNDMRTLVQRYTNSGGNTRAIDLLDSSAGGGFTGVLTVFYRAHWNADATTAITTDPSYTTALSNFVTYNKGVLLNTSASYQLDQAATEAFRFLQYPALKSTVKPEVQYALRYSSMTGADSDIWLAGASAVDYYDSASCADYGTCNYKTALANAVLVKNWTCSPSIRIRAQALTDDQMRQSCALMQGEESYFHTMMQTNRVPVANDNNTQLEVVVFDSSAQYEKYSGAIFGNSTDNGGIYLEGEPDQPGNQPRFIAYRAEWLTDFQVWNLNHEYVHYLDGRFDQYGDFATETQQPDVWYIEGLAEYISKKNNDQKAIDAAKSGQYALSQIFKNTYDMSDYVNRAYNWGYMATRFMFERHRSDIDAILPMFRKGDYASYERYIDAIGNRYDAEFASWVQAATTAGEPPLPGSGAAPTLPLCSSASNMQLGKGCSIQGLSSSSQAYTYLILPSGAKNLKLWTSAGTGDVDLYVAADRYPTTTSYDFASANIGNNESVAIPSPVAGHWYYIVLKARQPFSGMAINASYD